MGSTVSSQADAPERVALIRTPLVITAVVAVVVVVVAWFVAGGKGALSAALGAVVVLVFFGVGQAVVGRVLRTNPALGLNMALLVYVLQIGVLFVLLLLLRKATFLDSKAFAASVVVCVLTWIAGAIVGFSRTRMLTVEPGTGPPGADLSSLPPPQPPRPPDQA